MKKIRDKIRKIYNFLFDKYPDKKQYIIVTVSIIALYILSIPITTLLFKF